MIVKDIDWIARKGQSWASIWLKYFIFNLIINNYYSFCNLLNKSFGRLLCHCKQLTSLFFVSSFQSGQYSNFDFDLSSKKNNKILINADLLSMPEPLSFSIVRFICFKFSSIYHITACHLLKNMYIITIIMFYLEKIDFSVSSILITILTHLNYPTSIPQCDIRISYQLSTVFILPFEKTINQSIN